MVGNVNAMMMGAGVGMFPPQDRGSGRNPNNPLVVPQPKRPDITNVSSSSSVADIPLSSSSVSGEGGGGVMLLQVGPVAVMNGGGSRSGESMGESGEPEPEPQQRRLDPHAMSISPPPPPPPPPTTTTTQHSPTSETSQYYSQLGGCNDNYHGDDDDDDHHHHHHRDFPYSPRTTRLMRDEQEKTDHAELLLSMSGGLLGV